MISGRDEQLRASAVDARAPGLGAQLERLVQIGHRVAASRDRSLYAVEVAHASLDPWAELGDRRRGFPVARAAGDDDLDPARWVDGYPDAACALGAADGVIEIHGPTEYGPILTWLPSRT